MNLCDTPFDRDDEPMTNPTTEEMAREVYEAITGKCVHAGKPYGADEPEKCANCNDAVYFEMDFSSEHFPWLDLSTSIDAWHEHIFPVMSASQILAHDDALRLIANGEGFTWLRTAMHHLQAAYAVVKGE